MPSLKKSEAGNEFVEPRKTGKDFGTRNEWDCAGTSGSAGDGGMKNTIIKPVSDFAEVITGGTPSTRNTEYWDGDIPWINSGALNDGDIKTASKYITELGLKNSSTKLMPKDSVLVALTGATTGQVGYLTFEASANQSVTGILPSKEHYPRFLYYYLKTQRAKILGDAFGGAQPHINQKYVKDFKIPLPPLDDQKRIVHLLGKVEGLIARRKQHLQQLDDLLKSVFLEMFGDPLRNEKNYKITTLAPYITHLTSGGRGWAKYYAPSGKRFIRSLDVQMNAIGSDDVVYVTPPNNKETERTRVLSGDVLLTITGSKIGRVCFVPQDFEEAYISQHVAIIRTNGINPVYLSFYLSMPACGQRIIAKNQYGQAKPGLNLTQIQNFEIIVPDITLQNQFAAIVKKVEDLKARYQQSLADLERLYGALSQKAFKGELDLSWVPLPTEGPEITEKEKLEAEHKQPMEPLFELSAPADLAALKSPEGRKALLCQWLTATFGQQGDAPFAAQPFMEAAQQRLSELTEDDNALDWGAAEYDELKTWVFKALEQGHLTQGYDDANNRVQVKTTKG